MKHKLDSSNYKELEKAIETLIIANKYTANMALLALSNVVDTQKQKMLDQVMEKAA